MKIKFKESPVYVIFIHDYTVPDIGTGRALKRDITEEIFNNENELEDKITKMCLMWHVNQVDQFEGVEGNEINYVFRLESD